MKSRGDPAELDDSAVRAGREDADSQDDTNAQLRAMRAVWLAMREEAPPDGGLVDLLAAARAKAAAMRARPTLWQRVLAVLKRPPALAFATVVVLVGGAVLFIGRGKGMRADLAAGSSGAVKSLVQPSESIAPEVAGAAPAGAALDVGDKPAVAHAAQEIGAADSEPAARVERGAGAMKLDSRDAARSPEIERPVQPVVRAVPPARASAPHDRPPPVRQQEVRVGAGKRAGEQTAAEAREQALLEQLYKQSATAARRGDCEAVRKMIGRIAKTDRDYRARVQKEAAIVTCLGPPKDGVTDGVTD